jgi:5,10-methylenetetrahydromethanopterin reductase
MSRIQLGLGLQSDLTGDEAARLAQAAEAAGFATVSVFNDLLYPPPLPELLAIADATERVALGPACMNPYTVHPVEIAAQIASLDHRSNGRAYLGIAHGAWLGGIGLEQDRPVASMREAIAVIRAIWRGDESGVPGRRFTLEPGQKRRYPMPRHEVPIMVGTWSPGLAKLAGEVADEIKVSPSANPDVARLTRERAESDRARVVFGGATVVAEDGAAARLRAATSVAMYLPVIAALDPTVDADPELLDRIAAEQDHEAAGRLVPDGMLDRFVYAGTPEQVIEQVERLEDAGVDRIEFSAPEGFELLVGRVAPHFRERA